MRFLTTASKASSGVNRPTRIPGHQKSEVMEKTVNVLDGECNFLAKASLVELHLQNHNSDEETKWKGSGKRAQTLTISKGKRS
jgi:hypothetical protein